MKMIFVFCLCAITVQAQEIVALRYEEAGRLLDRNEPRHAAVVYERIIDYFLDRGEVSQIPENYLGMALSFAITGHYRKSVRFHRKALRAHRKYRSDEEPLAIRLNLGLTYELAGRFKKAQKILKG